MKKRSKANQTLFGEERVASVITAITPRASDPNIRVVKVNGKVAATLRAADVDALRLHVGKEWTTAIADSVEKVIAHNDARKQAIRLLAGRACSQEELINKLTSRGHNAHIARVVVDELKKDHWLDDRAYAEAVIRQTTRRKPAAKAMLLEKLAAKGIAQAVAKNAVRAAMAEESPLEQAAALAMRESAKQRGKSKTHIVRRVAAALGRRGFDDETVTAALELAGLMGDDAPPDREERGDYDE